MAKSTSAYSNVVAPANETVSGIQGTPTETNPAADQKTAMEELPANHTYRDRVEAQAKALGIKIEPGWTLERLMFEIRMQASS